MAKTSLNMRLDPELLIEAKKFLGTKQTTATVETALRNLVNNRKALAFFRKSAGVGHWKGFKNRG